MLEVEWLRPSGIHTLAVETLFAITYDRENLVAFWGEHGSDQLVRSSAPANAFVVEVPLVVCTFLF